MSPGDVRALRASQLAKDPAGAVFFAARGKTGTPVGGALSASNALFATYVPVNLATIRGVMDARRRGRRRIRENG
jgi:hypothetical protein